MPTRIWPPRPCWRRCWTACGSRPPVTGNAYAQSAFIPRSWQGAVDAFLGSDFIAEQFGTQFQHVFGQQKQRELLDYQAQVPDLDYARYLRTV